MKSLRRARAPHLTEGKVALARPRSRLSLSLSFALSLSLFSQLACARPKPVRNPESYDGAEGEFRAGDQPSYLYFDGANQRPGKRRDYDNHNGEK